MSLPPVDDERPSEEDDLAGPSEMQPPPAPEE